MYFDHGKTELCQRLYFLGWFGLEPNVSYTIYDCTSEKAFCCQAFLFNDTLFHSGLRSSARNIFIASLALADLILCVFNMPLTLILTLTKSWPFYSDSWIFCKSILTLQAVTVFLSSFLITLIALDRRHFILNPSKKQVHTTHI